MRLSETNMTITDNESADLTAPTGPMRTYVFRPVAILSQK